MSNILHRFDGPMNKGKPMYVNAFVGSNGDASIQFTIDGSWCALTSAEVVTLLNILEKRIRREKGYTATD